MRHKHFTGRGDRHLHRDESFYDGVFDPQHDGGRVVTFSTETAEEST